MVNAFEEASALQRIDDHTFRARIPDGWQQGRGAFGGLILGTLLRAMEQSEPEPRRSVRVLTGDLCGAVLPGEAEIHVAVLRRGGRVSYLDAQLRQQAQVMARASAVLASSRDDVAAPALPAPAPPRPPPWQSVTPVAVKPPFGPAFARVYEYRLTGPATVTFTAELLCDPATLPAAEPLFYRAHVAALREWMFVEFRELWHQDRPVAMNQQTFALLG
jgi:acyl-CoA thioesterase